jgi:hypothetical protein
VCWLGDAAGTRAELRRISDWSAEVTLEVGVMSDLCGSELRAHLVCATTQSMGEHVGGKSDALRSKGGVGVPIPDGGDQSGLGFTDSVERCALNHLSPCPLFGVQATMPGKGTEVIWTGEGSRGCYPRRGV